MDRRFDIRPEELHGLRGSVGRRLVGRVVVPAAIIYAVLVGVGLLLAHPLARLVSGEDGLNRELVGDSLAGLDDGDGRVQRARQHARRGRCGDRGGPGDALDLRPLGRVDHFGHRRAPAGGRLSPDHNVDRQRPAVEHLDPAPPTSSFPSGHTGAATALYVGVAVVIAWRVRHKLLRVLLVAVFVTVPILVAVSRLYRGMHHPTDVVFGALNGLACLAVAVYAFQPRSATAAPAGVTPTTNR